GSLAAQSETKARRTFVHGAVFRDARIFGVLHDRKIQLRAETKRGAHDLVVENGLAVVGDGDGSGALQCREISEICAARFARGSSDREDVHDRAALWTAQPR